MKTGADPGIFVRGGVQLSENFDNKKKRGGGEDRKREVVMHGSFPSAEVYMEFKLTFQTIIYIQVYFRYGMVFLYT